MPYNIKQLGEKSVSIDFFIADPNYAVHAEFQINGVLTKKEYRYALIAEQRQNNTKRMLPCAGGFKFIKGIKAQ